MLVANTDDRHRALSGTLLMVVVQHAAAAAAASLANNSLRASPALRVVGRGLRAVRAALDILSLMARSGVWGGCAPNKA